MKSVLRFRTVLIGLYLLILPIDATLGNILGPISLINYIVIFYVFIRLINLTTEGINLRLLENCKVQILYFSYFILSISWSLSNHLNNWYIFSLMGSFLMFFFASIDTHTDKEYNFLKKMIIFSGAIVIIITILNLDLGSGARFTLDFGREMDPNYFSTGFILITALLMDNILKKKLLIFNLALLIAMLLVILLTGSRGGLIANLFVIIVSIFINSKNNRIRNFIFMVSGSILFIIAFSLVKNYIPEWVLSRFTIEEITVGGGSGRTEIWLANLHYFEQMSFLGILFGNGFSTFSYISSISLGIARAPHSIYVQSLIEGGIFGLLITVFLIMSAMKRALSINRKYIFAALCGAAVGGITLDIHVSRFLWMILLFSMITIRKKTPNKFS
ncbi:O-antigen ligase [Exiguobacterium sp. s189]|uniref:O-antigen ligase family protein n=1 Tax=Exiguobacterium sp. s189 TaxID=2751263 RepID=UPI001BEC46D1|nr:O-antigen ligase family protein [Exiguobacterium sp. s189]